jgi:DNA invertase Pin-like site-specific DNA recombinase
MKTVDVSKRFVVYFRVSTKRQGMSGLGLEAQQIACKEYVKANDAVVMPKEFIEVESGKCATRPQLLAAISYARAANATLLVAKLDRLSRNVGFLSTLMDNKIPFKAIDHPHADEFTIHIMAAVAQKEAKMISARTKAALSAYKARGGVLGGARPECRENMPEASRAKGRAAGAMANRAVAIDHYNGEIVNTCRKMRADGATLQTIANQLNADGLNTRRGASVVSQI